MEKHNNMKTNEYRLIPDCFTCKHYSRGLCPAWAGGLIPNDISTGVKKHRKPIKGQIEPLAYERDKTIEIYGEEEPR